MRDRVRQDAQKATTEGASYLKLPRKVNFFAPKAEEYELDFLPYENEKDKHPKGYEKGELIPYLRFKVHSGIGAEDNKYVCPTSIGKKCPICEERNRMAKSANGDSDIIKALTPKERTLFQVIDLEDEKKGVQLFDHSYHLFAKRLLGDIDSAENSTGKKKKSLAHAGFAELEEGQTLSVRFIEKKMGTNKFYEVDRIDAEDRDPYEEDILDDVLNLDDCLKVLPYDELEAIFLELDPEEQGNSRKREKDDEEDKGSRRSRKEKGDEEEPPSRSRRGRSSEKDEEPEETPSRSRRSKPAEDEDPEEKPARSRRGAAKEDKEEEPPARSRRSKPADDEPEEKSSRRSRSAAKDEEPEEKSSRSRRGEAKEENLCYVEDGVFGKDCDTHTDDNGGKAYGEKGHIPNCYDCPEATWKKCKAAQVAGDY